MAIQHSSAVRELIEAIWATADAQDGEQMAELHADDPNLVFVVAAPSEAWHGFGEVKDGIRAAHDSARRTVSRSSGAPRSRMATRGGESATAFSRTRAAATPSV